jgi:hypothetical protein
MSIFSRSKCLKPIKETVVQVPKAFGADVERFTAIEYQWLNLHKNWFEISVGAVTVCQRTW